MTIRMPHNVLAGDIIHSVGATAPASPIPGTIWLDTSAAAQATPLIYGPNGEIMLHASGAGSVGRITRTAGPQEDVHLRSGDAVGSYAMVEAQSGSYLCSNCFWDGVAWQRYDTGQAATAVAMSSGGMTVHNVAAGANPITWTLTSLPTAQLVALATPSVARMASYEAADIKTNTAYPAVTWTDLNAYRNFTIGSATSWATVEVRFATLLFAAGSPQVGARLVVNGTLTYPLASAVIPAPAGNLAGSLSMRLPPGVLVPGTNTMWIQLWGGAAFNVYCRCATAPQTEWVHMLVAEHGV